MKKFWWIYFSLALMASATARADYAHEVSLPISSIYFNDGSWQIKIQGPLANPCLSNPSIDISHSDAEPQTLVFQVVAKRTTDICMQVIRGGYQLSVDLKEALAAHNLNLEPGKNYVLKAEKHAFEMLFSADDVLQVRPQMIPITRVIGQIHEAHNGSWSVLTQDHKLISVRMAVNPKEYVNQTVSIAMRPARSLRPMGGNDFGMPALRNSASSSEMIVFGIGVAAP